MNSNNWVIGAKLYASTDSTVHTLKHLSITTLNSIEVKGFSILSLKHRRGCSATHADAVCRASNLDDQHSLLLLALICVHVVDLTDTTGKHDGLDPLHAFRLSLLFLALGSKEWHTHTKRTCVSADDRFAELVSVVRSTVGGLNHDLKRAGLVARILEALILPRQLVARNVEVSNAVSSCTCKNKRSSSRCMSVSQTTASSSFSTRERSNTRGKVVGLSSEEDVVMAFCLNHLSWKCSSCSFIRQQKCDRFRASSSF
mmetsp:Transcript_20104/g.28027  ORF Transcript_20104/g.28027 Transcript_20104/m.28027 type:complete len:257 (-) Transcript_20104:912-1682(-)